MKKKNKTLKVVWTHFSCEGVINCKLANHNCFLRINLTGTGFTPRVIVILASKTLLFHACFDSPGCSNGSILKSRSNIVRKHTASVVANLRPMQVRGPIR